MKASHNPPKPAPEKKVLGGLLMVGSGQWWSQPKGVSRHSGRVGPALSTALCISIYSVIHGAAVRFMAPAPYTVLVFGLTSLCVAPLVLRQYGYHGVVAVWRTAWLRILVVGILTLLTYMLVLQAYAIAHLGYVGALREVSIVLAALAGWRWLDESFGAVRTIGAIVIFCGILVIATAG